MVALCGLIRKLFERVQDFGVTTNDDFLILYLMDLLNLILFNRQIKFNTEEFLFRSYFVKVL